MQQHLMF